MCNVQDKSECREQLRLAGWPVLIDVGLGINAPLERGADSSGVFMTIPSSLFSETCDRDNTNTKLSFVCGYLLP